MIGEIFSQNEDISNGRPPASFLFSSFLVLVTLARFAQVKENSETQNAFLDAAARTGRHEKGCADL